MNVAIWGPRLWRVMHGIACLTNPLTSTPQDMAAAAFVFTSLNELLPCSYCRESYASIFARSARGRSFATIFRDDLQRFVYDLHNYVNEKLQRQRLAAAHLSPSPAALRALFPPPSLVVVEKRCTAALGRPFSEDDVWFSLYAFVLLIDSAADEDRKRRHWAVIQHWARALSQVLVQQPQYKVLTAGLRAVSKPVQGVSSSSAAFRIVANAQGSLPMAAIWKIVHETLPA